MGIEPLNWGVPIVDSEGRPTAEFLMKWNQQGAINGEIPTLDSPAEVSAVLDVLGSTRGSLLVRTSTGWVILPPGTAGRVLTSAGAGADPLWDPLPGIQAMLDSIDDTHGAVLFRGASGWQALAPGTAGYVLQTGGAGADPAWAASGGGGGGTPTLVQHAAAVISSTAPVITLPAAPTAGNMLVACVTRWASSITLSAGWTAGPTWTPSATYDTSATAWKIAGAGESATQQPWTSPTGWSMALFEIANAAGSTLWSSDVRAAAASTTSLTALLATPKAALGIGVFTVQMGGSAVTPNTMTVTGATSGSTAFNTLGSNGGSRRVQAFYSTLAAKGAFNPVCTYSAASIAGVTGLVVGGV